MDLITVAINENNTALALYRYTDKSHSEGASVLFSGDNFTLRKIENGDYVPLKIVS